MDPALVFLLFSQICTENKQTKRSSRFRVSGGDAVFRKDKEGGGGVAAGDSSPERDEFLSGDGPHPPAVGSAHHIVKVRR